MEYLRRNGKRRFGKNGYVKTVSEKIRRTRMKKNEKIFFRKKAERDFSRIW